MNSDNKSHKREPKYNGSFNNVHFSSTSNDVCDFSSSKVQKQVAFTSNPLFKVNVKKLMFDGQYKLAPARFSQLDISSTKDIESIKEALKKDNVKCNFYGYICDDIIGKDKNYQYYAIEQDKFGKKLADRITCLVEISEPETPHGAMSIAMLSASSRIYKSEKPPIKGSGELAIYGLVKIAREKEYSKVTLISANDEFYEKIGFHLDGIRTVLPQYELKANEYDDFIERVEQKYDIKPNIIEEPKNNLLTLVKNIAIR